MSVVVLGAGIVGSASIWDLKRRGHDVEVADADPESVARATERFEVAASIVDANNLDEVRAVLGPQSSLLSTST
jgi:saccharopine dehydrogenase-like NADP-dependent oxidoreductase